MSALGETSGRLRYTAMLHKWPVLDLRNDGSFEQNVTWVVNLRLDASLPARTVGVTIGPSAPVRETRRIVMPFPR